MAHELFIDVRGKASMAYVNDLPWHGLGQKLTVGAPIEKWAAEAGMNFKLQDIPVAYKFGGESRVFASRKILIRDDTGDALAVVGDRYQVVQPIEVLEFFRNLTERGGFQLETAGVLFGGAKYWALARTGDDAKIGGKSSKDVIKSYVLLATSCDGTLQTTAQHTSVRVVCNNTLTASLMSETDKIGAVKVSHRTSFDATDVQEKMGLVQGWKDFVSVANELARIKVDAKRAADFVAKLLATEKRMPNARDLSSDERTKILESKQAATILQLFDGKARGSDMLSSRGTAWGLVNAVTETVDHLQGKDQSNRLYHAWFHSGNQLKRHAFEQAVELA